MGRGIRALPVDDVVIIMQLADGDTMADIAREYDCAAATVKKRLKTIYLEYGAHTAAQLVALAYHRGHLLPKGQ